MNATTPPSNPWLYRLQVIIGVLLGITLATAAACLAATVCGAVFGLDVPGFSPTVELPAEALGDDAPVTPAGNHVEAELTTVTVVPDAPSTEQYLWYGLGRLPEPLVATGFLWTLWRTVRDARRDDPFTAATVTRLRRLGGIVLIGGPVAVIAESITVALLRTTVVPAEQYFAIGTRIPAIWIAGGVGLFAIADILDRGIELRRDLSGLV